MAIRNDGLVRGKHLGKGLVVDESAKKINVDLNPFIDNSTIDFNEFGLLSATNIKHFKHVCVQNLHAFTPFSGSSYEEKTNAFHDAMVGFRGVAYIGTDVPVDYLRQAFGATTSSNTRSSELSTVLARVNVKFEEFISPSAPPSDDGNISNVSTDGDIASLARVNVNVTQTVSFEDSNNKLRIFTRSLNTKTNNKSNNPTDRVAVVSLDATKYGTARRRTYIVLKDLTPDDWYDWVEITNVANATVTTPPVSTTGYTASNGVKFVGNDIQLDLGKDFIIENGKLNLQRIKAFYADLISLEHLTTKNQKHQEDIRSFTGISKVTTRLKNTGIVQNAVTTLPAEVQSEMNADSEFIWSVDLYTDPYNAHYMYQGTQKKTFEVTQTLVVYKGKIPDTGSGFSHLADYMEIHSVYTRTLQSMFNTVMNPNATTHPWDLFTNSKYTEWVRTSADSIPSTSVSEVTASNGLEKVGNDIRAKVDGVSIKVNTQGQLHTDISSAINQYPIKTDYVYETYAIVQQGDEFYRMPLAPNAINSGDVVMFDSGWYETEADTVDHPQKATRVWSTPHGNIRRIRVGDKIRIKGRVKNTTLSSADFLATIKVSNAGDTHHGSGNDVDLTTVLSFDWDSLAKSGNTPQGTTVTREGDKIKVTSVPRGESAYFTIDATVNTFPASKRIQVNTNVDFTGNYAGDPAWNTKAKYGRSIGCYAYLDGMFDVDEYLGDADWVSMLGFDSNRVTLRRNGTYPPAENWFSKKPANIKSYAYNGKPPALTSDNVNVGFVVTGQDNSTFTFTTNGKQVIS